jgi:hypothetical protein
MFGICIWYELINTNIYHKINKHLSMLFKSQLHIPHLTALKNIKYIDNEHLILKKNIYSPKPFFKNGLVYQTKLNNFYSIQQDYNDIENNIYHVSLAYKVNKPFLEKDILYCNTLNLPAIINPNEINVTMWNCNSIYTNKWFKIN